MSERDWASPLDKIIAEKLEGTVVRRSSSRYQTVETQGDDSEGLLEGRLGGPNHYLARLCRVGFVRRWFARTATKRTGV